MAHIKINDVSPFIQYTATASQTEFIIPFPFFSDSDIICYRDNDFENPVSSDDYTLSGAGNTEASSSGGTLTMDTGESAGTIVTIIRQSTLSRTTDFTDGGDFSADNLNDQLDKIITYLQEARELHKRTLKLPWTSPLTDVYIPADFEGEAGSIVLVNSDEDGFEFGASISGVENAAANATAAAASATSASNSATAAAASATSASNSATAAAAAKDVTLATWQGPWQTATDYEVGEKVSNDGSSYICTSAHTSGASTEPGTGGSWGTVWDVLAAQGSAGAGSGDLLASNNLSDVANAATARANLGLAIGTNVQAYDADLNTLAANITTAGHNIVAAVDADAQTALLSAVVGDSGSGGTKGLVPAPAAGDAAANKFLKADGTWAAQGSGSVTAGTNYIAYVAPEILVDDTSYIQTHRFVANCTGTVRIGFQIKNSTGGAQNVTLQIEKNNSSQTTQARASTSYGAYTYDMDVTAGDVIDINCRSTTSLGHVKEVWIGVAEASTPAMAGSNTYPFV